MLLVHIFDVHTRSTSQSKMQKYSAAFTPCLTVNIQGLRWHGTFFYVHPLSTTLCCAVFCLDCCLMKASILNDTQICLSLLVYIMYMCSHVVTLDTQTYTMEAHRFLRESFYWEIHLFNVLSRVCRVNMKLQLAAYYLSKTAIHSLSKVNKIPLPAPPKLTNEQIMSYLFHLKCKNYILWFAVGFCGRLFCSS